MKNWIRLAAGLLLCGILVWNGSSDLPTRINALLGRVIGAEPAGSNIAAGVAVGVPRRPGFIESVPCLDGSEVRAMSMPELGQELINQATAGPPVLGNIEMPSLITRDAAEPPPSLGEAGPADSTEGADVLVADSKSDSEPEDKSLGELEEETPDLQEFVGPVIRGVMRPSMPDDMSDPFPAKMQSAT